MQHVWTFRQRWYVRAHPLERGLWKPVGLPGAGCCSFGAPALHPHRLQDPLSVSVESLYNNASIICLKCLFDLNRAPITTATSVIAVKFDKGVMMAADILGSYGSLARFRNCPRLVKLNSNIIIGASGDYADFQYLKDIMERKMYVVKYFCKNYWIILICIVILVPTKNVLTMECISNPVHFIVG